METEIMPIEVDLIPYDFDLTLSGKDYNFLFTYNRLTDGFHCTLSKDGVVIVSAEPIMYGFPMFEALQRDSNLIKSDEFFTEVLLPFDFTNQTDVVNSQTFGKLVNIYILELGL